MISLKHHLDLLSVKSTIYFKIEKVFGKWIISYSFALPNNFSFFFPFSLFYLKNK